MPLSVEKKKFIELTKIPYVPYFSYGEKLPVIEQGTSDPTSIGFSYENIAGLLANNLGSIELFIEKRDSFLEKAKKIILLQENKTDPLDSKGVKNIYISYSRKDFEITQRIKSQMKPLERTDNIKLLSGNDSILPGEEWDDQIKKMIDSSDIFLSILSADAIDSKDLMDEINYAFDKKKLVIPVYIGESNFIYKHPRLSRIQGIYLDMDKKNEETSFARFGSSIKQVIRNLK